MKSVNLTEIEANVLEAYIIDHGIKNETHIVVLNNILIKCRYPK